MSNKAYTISDLKNDSQKLADKFKMDEYAQEINVLLAPVGLDYGKIVRQTIDPTYEALIDAHPVAEKVESVTKKLGTIKKRYRYESYLRSGRSLREKFLKARKTYLFNRIKLTLGKNRRCSNIEKINMDFLRQYLMARGIDKALRASITKIATIYYEDHLTGEDRVMKVKFHRVAVDVDTVEAPLIDRTMGSNFFDSFFLHSFYNVESKKWEYIPVGLIQKIEGISHDLILKGFANADF